MLHIPGGMALVSIWVCVAFQEFYAISAFLLTSIVSFGIGQLLYRSVQQYSEQAHLRHAMITVALSWALIPLVGAIPFVAVASHLALLSDVSDTLVRFQNPWNAIFEAFSGFTSTGLTMALNSRELPYSLQWWRSFMQWIGGVGTIVLMLCVLDPTIEPFKLYNAEGRSKRIALTVTGTVRRIWKIYLIYTGVCIGGLGVLGMPWWEALNHGLTVISTGGFDVTGENISAYSPVIQLAIVPMMIAGAIGFAIHDRLLRDRHFSVLWNREEYRALWLLLGVGVLVLLLENYWFHGSLLWIDSAFQWVSALTTCGFNTADVETWSNSAKVLLTVAMVIGGAAGSTVGGLKIKRVLTLYKGVVWHFRRISLRPHQLMRYQLDGKSFGQAQAYRQIEKAAILAVLWMSWLGVGVIVLNHLVPEGYQLSDTIFEAASALSGVGLSTGISHPDLQWGGKLVLILLMWMGRLEIIPVMLLLGSLISGIKASLLRF
ncbi:TrkH family potassium uptake protein [Phormidium pseudopriestleyi FRX01]|uniref:TrkH family potassium uptake protein n=2 Tax=Phormidium TaxID=1198 RepID=A0ABS3FTG6_9CYAN|nr:TrkH family potassium uptake protein [Phormidium pseudopriestleyi]MBO0350132.1 TrkH family potassium uptake protein [Phormidium pseudopriestleyi FRX01]